MDKIKYFVIGMVGAIFIDGFAFAIYSATSNKYGSLADWVSGLGTLLAFGIVIWQQHTQEKAERAFRVEQNRPRFMIMYRGEMPDKANILYNKPIDDKQLLYSYIRSGSSEIVTLENISDNTIYSLEVIIKYKSGFKDYWKRDGIHGNDIIALIPSRGKNMGLDALQSYKMKVRFLTAANETGFWLYDDSDLDEKGKYFFIKNAQNNQIRASDSGKMTDKSKKVKNWIKEFDALNRTFRWQFTIPYGQLKEDNNKKLVEN